MLVQLRSRSYAIYRSLPILGRIVDEFTEWCHHCGYSVATIRCQLTDILFLAGYFRKRGVKCVEELKPEHFETAWKRIRSKAPRRAGTVWQLQRFLQQVHGLKQEAFRPATRVGSDPEYGQQFQAERLTSTPPTSKEGIEKYLGSGMVKGIGPVYAKKLVDRFGEGVFDIIEKASARLEEVDGIGPTRRKRIKAAWDEQKVVRDIMLFLHSNGVSTSRAVRIYRTYGEGAIEKVRSDPYRLPTSSSHWCHHNVSAAAIASNSGRISG